MKLFSEEVFPPSPEKPKQDYDDYYENGGWYYENIQDIAKDVKVGGIVSGIDCGSKEHISGTVVKIELNQMPAYNLYILNNGKSLFTHEITRWTI